MKTLVISILFILSLSINTSFSAQIGPISNKTLHQASADGDIARVRLLISGGANVNEKVDGFTPLHSAAERGHRDVVEILIENGADVNAKGNANWTPLHLAATSGKHDVVELLIIRGADVNAKDQNGRTPMWWAEIKGHNQVVELLKKRGAEQEKSEGPVDKEKEIKTLEDRRQEPNQVIDLKSIANIDPLTEPNAVKQRIKKFQDLDEAFKNLQNQGEKEIAAWISGLEAVNPDIVKVVYEQVAAEFDLVRKQAAVENAEKTSAAIDGVILYRSERFYNIIEKMQEDMMDRRELELRRGKRTRRVPRGRTDAIDRTNPIDSEYGRSMYQDNIRQNGRRRTPGDITERQLHPEFIIKLPFDDPNKVEARLKAFEGLEKELKTLDRFGIREMRGWTTRQSASSPILAKAVYQQVKDELTCIRKHAVGEAAAKTTVAIDGLLVTRQERLDKITETILEEIRKLRRMERRPAGIRPRR